MTRKFEREMRELITGMFEKEEQGLADYLADCFIDYADMEGVEDQSASSYFYDDGDDLYDAGSDELFRFLYKYATDGLYDAIDWELGGDSEEEIRDAFDELVDELYLYAPGLDKDMWYETFEEWMEENF